MSTRLDALTDHAPFAIYVWDLITHIEHSLALAMHAAGLTEQIRRACQVADDAIGVMLASLERKGLLDRTTIVVYGDGRVISQGPQIDTYQGPLMPNSQIRPTSAVPLGRRIHLHRTSGLRRPVSRDFPRIPPPPTPTPLTPAPSTPAH